MLFSDADDDNDEKCFIVKNNSNYFYKIKF